MFHDDDVGKNVDLFNGSSNINNTNNNRSVYTFMKESLILFFHQILYYRSIYPIEVFISLRPECINGILCYICQNPVVIQYIDSFVHQVIETIRYDHHHHQNDDNNSNEYIDCLSCIILDQKKDHTNSDHTNLDNNQYVTSLMASTPSTQSTNDTSTIANNNNISDQKGRLVPKEGYMLQFLNDHSMNHNTNNYSTQHRRSSNNTNNNKNRMGLPYNNNKNCIVSKIEKKDKERQEHEEKHYSLWILWERSIREMILRIQRSSNNISLAMNSDDVSKSLCSSDKNPISIWSKFVTFQLHIHRKIERNTSLLLPSGKETESTTTKNLTWNGMNNNTEWIIWNDQVHDIDDDEVVVIVEDDSISSTTTTLCPIQTKSKKTIATTTDIRPLDEYLTPFGTIQLNSIIY